MSFALSLIPWPAKAQELDSLQVSIGRINEERGQFRNITEHTLQEEIERGDLGDSGQESPDDEEKAQDVEARRKELYAARADMLKHIGQAQNEALTALDFISLLISKDAPRQADISMSPFLKETIPVGTLAFDRGPPVRPTKAEEESAKNVTTGWNLQTLNSAANKLLSSAIRLEKEMEKEARYWEQILSISDMGWSVCKIPREGHTIGVRFGFSEASPIFSGRGLAALRPDSDGNIVLDQGLSHQPKSIRIRLARHGAILGTSSFSSPLDSSQATLEELIRQARDSLFEEELYQEIISGARNLLSYGVKILDNEVWIVARQEHLLVGDAALENPLQIIIDQVAPREHTNKAPDNYYDHMADGLALALRILLTDIYHQRFLARTRAPSPISNDKRSAPVSEILRPIICHFKHSDAMNSLQFFLTNLTRTLRSARLSASWSVDAHQPSRPSDQSTTSSAVSLELASLDSLLVSTIKLDLTGQIKPTITIITQLATPDYGTSFRLELESPLQIMNVPQTTKFHDIDELHEHLRSLVRQSVAAHIAHHCHAWVLEPSGHDLRSMANTRIKRLTIALQNNRLALLSGYTGESPKMLAVWQVADDAEDDTTPQKGLDEMMEEVTA